MLTITKNHSNQDSSNDYHNNNDKINDDKNNNDKGNIMVRFIIIIINDNDKKAKNHPYLQNQRIQ